MIFDFDREGVDSNSMQPTGYDVIQCLQCPSSVISTSKILSKMAVTAVSFRWLDILEKEFDKAFVDLDILLGDLDSDDPEMLFSARQKMSTLSSCFAQLTHKAQTIFQNSAKLEAELVHIRTEVVDTKTRNQELEEELHAVLVSLHTTQLQQLPGSDNLKIQNKLQQGLVERSPTHKAVISGVNMDNLVMSLENWKAQLELENESLRNTVVGLQAEVCGARLAARYLDKELAGRIQQLQLLGRSDMTGDARDRLWSQLEAEILVQRQKTVMRAVRQRETRVPPAAVTGAVRTVRLMRHPHQGLGISITGGREHGVPILISELEPGGGGGSTGAGGQLFVGDAVLSVNGVDLRQASHQEAVKVLSSQIGSVTLTVQYLANVGDESEDDNDFNNLRYGFFDDANDGVDFYRTTNGYSQNNSKDRPATPTPTAPRTPDSLIRGESECSYPNSPIASHKDATSCNADERGTEPSVVEDEEDPPTAPPAVTSERSVHISTTEESQPSVPPIVVSPKHFGVTTLQKIFRSLTPSGVWSDGTEEESNDNNETGDDDEKSPTAVNNRLKPVVTDDVTTSEAKQPANNINDNIEEIILRQGGTSIVAQRMVPNKKGQNSLDGIPRWREQLQKESSQLFHPETEAISLVDGHGDATFGTPV